MSHGNLVICVPHGVWDCNQCSQEKADEASRALAASHQRLKEALEAIKRRAFSDEPAEELEDVQRDLRHIHALAERTLKDAP